MLTITQIMPVMLLTIGQTRQHQSDAYSQLCEGNFAVQRGSSIGFIQTLVDQTIEQTFNKDIKTKG